jgi:N6-L-threonylcarbamoyladenine synthase
VRDLEKKGDVPVADVAASFQKAITEMLAEKTARAAAEHTVETVLLGGGVAANLALREAIARRIGHPLRVPRPGLCTDNGAMIGAAAARRLAAGDLAGLDLDARPSLPLARREAAGLRS